MNTKYSFKKVESLNQLAIRQARYSLESQNKNVSSIATNRLAKKRLKEYKSLISQSELNYKISFTAMFCSETNKEIGFYINSLTIGISILSLVYVYPEYRKMGHFEHLVNHYEENCSLISGLEVKPDDLEFPKSLYKKWGYNKTVGGLLPNNYLLIKETEVENLKNHADKVNESLAA
ncbi:hypothetical protein VCRA2117O328_10232 [Vibrio crassostreae]|nr:hypothetical protein VCRA2117O328_10232 [Vibrio crassostreae]